jgi:hypothetical protein
MSIGDWAFTLVTLTVTLAAAVCAVAWKVAYSDGWNDGRMHEQNRRNNRQLRERLEQRATGHPYPAEGNTSAEEWIASLRKDDSEPAATGRKATATALLALPAGYNAPPATTGEFRMVTDEFIAKITASEQSYREELAS